MLVRLRKGLPEQEVESILGFCKELGYRPRVLDRSRQILELEPGGENGQEPVGRPEHRSRLEDLTGVHSVIDSGTARERHEARPLDAGPLDSRPQDAGPIQVGEVRFGQGEISLIAGPCAIEDHERLLEIARCVRDRGAGVLRAGAYKPRTSPYSFQGLGERGLALLSDARKETGLPVVTEVLDPRDVERVASAADMIQIGARSMTNQPLLREVGRLHQPVLLKRGFGATVREFLLAAEYVLEGGNQQVVLCERGVRGPTEVTRSVLDVGAVAYLKQATHLPVIVDPSHAAGRADLVRPLARAGIAAGADGLIVEVHTHPAEVHSDGAQAISPEELERIVADVEALAKASGRRLNRPSRAPGPDETHTEREPGIAAGAST